MLRPANFDLALAILAPDVIASSERTGDSGTFLMIFSVDKHRLLASEGSKILDWRKKIPVQNHLLAAVQGNRVRSYL